jgi:hypothetical protein
MTGGHRAIIFGFLPQNLKTMAVAVAFIMAWREARDQAGTEEDQARGLLAAFRGELYGASRSGQMRCSKCATRLLLITNPASQAFSAT